MGLSIKYKLFLAILSAHVFMYVFMYSTGRYSFERGFLEYVSRIEERQVPALVEGLSNFYMHTGSWERIRRSPRAFGSLLRQSIESTVDASLPTAQVNRPSPGGGFSPNDWYYTSEYSPARPYLLLLDVNKSIIFGDPKALPLANLNSISVSGHIVGYLAVTSRQELSEQADVLFFEQQRQSFFLYAIALICISALIAFPASTFLVRPIRDVVNGTLALTNGEYDSRIKVRGSDELGQLSRDFNTLAKTLEQNRNARQQWIADISHELRTPLAILQGELESVQDGIRPLNAATLDSLHYEVIHLNALVNDLHELSLSDLGALVYEKKQINLGQILEQSIEMHHQLTEQNNIKVNLEVDSVVAGGKVSMLADANRLSQLFSNFMQNTCRYTDTGGNLSIKLRESADVIKLEWYDSSPGVSDEDLEHLFDRLYRVDSSRNRQKGGSGLGLAIAKNIIDAHDGTIRAEHSSLGGLKLIIEFPKIHNHIS